MKHILGAKLNSLLYCYSQHTKTAKVFFLYIFIIAAFNCSIMYQNLFAQDDLEAPSSVFIDSRIKRNLNLGDPNSSLVSELRETKAKADTVAELSSQYIKHKINYILTLLQSREPQAQPWDALSWEKTLNSTDISIINKIDKYIVDQSDLLYIKEQSQDAKRAICNYYLLTKNRTGMLFLNIPDEEFIYFYNLIAKKTYNEFRILIESSVVDRFFYRKLLFAFEYVVATILKDNKQNNTLVEANAGQNI